MEKKRGVCVITYPSHDLKERRRPMKPVIDLNKEYALMLDGGGARGAYQIGAWKALREAGVKICAVAGTSVGALNGAFICMDDLEKAEKVWGEIAFSKVMDVDDTWMERLFDGENKVGDVLHEIWNVLKEGGVDVTPLRNLIHENIDEKKIRESGKEFCILTFSVTDMKELDLSIRDIPEGLLEDYLLASAYLVGFKNEKLHGKTYIDGGFMDNVPMGPLVERGYKDIIQIRIFGPGREPKVKITEDMEVLQIAPRVRLGSIIEFQKKRSRQNMKIGYYDAQRVIFGLKGRIYYIEETKEECYYKTRIQMLTDRERIETAFELRMPLGYTEEELYLTMLEASAKLLHVQKYKIYTIEELLELVCKRYEETKEKGKLPAFTHLLMEMENKVMLGMKTMYNEENIVLCASNAYEQKYYLNPDFSDLPEQIQNELKIMCVLYTEEIGGILALKYEEDGTLVFEVSSEENDFLYDDIGSRLKIKELQRTKEDLLRSLELYYKVFFLGEEV